MQEIIIGNGRTNADKMRNRKKLTMRRTRHSGMPTAKSSPRTYEPPQEPATSETLVQQRASASRFEADDVAIVVGVLNEKRPRHLRAGAKCAGVWGQSALAQDGAWGADLRKRLLSTVWTLAMRESDIGKTPDVLRETPESN